MTPLGYNDKQTNADVGLSITKLLQIRDILVVYSHKYVHISEYNITKMEQNSTQLVVSDIGVLNITMAVTMTIVCIVFLIIVAGNILTILAFIKNHSLRKVRNYFLVSLAVGDIILGVLNLLGFTVIIMPTVYLGRKQGFSALPALSSMSIVLSYLHILVITVDCFLCIMKPLHYHQLMSPRRAKIIIGAIWTVAVVSGSFIFINEYYVARSESTLPFDMYDTLLKTVVWIIVVSAVIVMYVKIYSVVRQHKRQVLALSHQGQNAADNNGINSASHENRNKNIKRLVMVFLIIISLIILWLPYHIVSILYFFYPSVLLYAMSSMSVVLRFFIIVNTIAFINSAVNAFIYARFDKEFRNAYKEILQCKRT